MLKLHPQLRKDCLPLGTFPLCRLLLVNDSRFPWFILVPAREDIREIYQLVESDRNQFLIESCSLSEYLMKAFEGEKLNVAAMGNMVPQLHLHHVVRYSSDTAWPRPIWGTGVAEPYSGSEIKRIQAMIADSSLNLAGLVID